MHLTNHELNSMTFTNMASPQVNRKQARRHRAAMRLQTSGAYFDKWDTSAQQELESKLRDFVGLCRNGAISPQNVYAASINILARVEKVMGAKNHQFWITRFNDEGLHATYRKAV
jgi:hypothetical protein